MENNYMDIMFACFGASSIGIVIVLFIAVMVDYSPFQFYNTVNFKEEDDEGDEWKKG